MLPPVPGRVLIMEQNPVTDHLPANTIKLSEYIHRSVPPHTCADAMVCDAALSGDAPTVRLSRYLPTLPDTHNVAVFVGAMARGRDDFADAIVDEKISISDFPLSASVACGKVSCPPSSRSRSHSDARFPSSSAVHWRNSGILFEHGIRHAHLRWDIKAPSIFLLGFYSPSLLVQQNGPYCIQPAPTPPHDHPTCVHHSCHRDGQCCVAGRPHAPVYVSAVAEPPDVCDSTCSRASRRLCVCEVCSATEKRRRGNIEYDDVLVRNMSQSRGEQCQAVSRSQSAPAMAAATHRDHLQRLPDLDALRLRILPSITSRTYLQVLSPHDSRPLLLFLFSPAHTAATSWHSPPAQASFLPASPTPITSLYLAAWATSPCPSSTPSQSSRRNSRQRATFCQSAMTMRCCSGQLCHGHSLLARAIVLTSIAQFPSCTAI